MSTPEPATEMTPLEYLKQADKEMAAGNGKGAAGLLSKAIESTLVELGRQRHLDIGDLNEVAKTLEADSEVDKYHYQGTLITAQMLREHADQEVMESHELEGAYMVTRKFIIGCHGEFE